MTESQELHGDDDYEYPPDLVAEHMAILEHGEPGGLTVRLRGPRDPAPTKAQVKRFQRRSQLTRARHNNSRQVAARLIAARRAPRQRRVRRDSSIARAPAPTSSDGPAPVRELGAATPCAPLGERP